MATPTLKVEIAFDSDPLTASPTWTDVTEYVRDNSVRISRGRPTELDTFAAGQCSFTLDNRDARFSPLNSSSTYNGKLLPGKQVRITGSYGGTDYRLFRGFITGWPQRYSQGKKDAIVPIVAYDALSKLNEMSLSDPVRDYMEACGTLTNLWRSLDGKTWQDVVGSKPAVYQKGQLSAGSSLADGLSATGVQGTALRMAFPRTIESSGYQQTFSMWVQTSTAGASSSSFMAMLSGPVGLFTSRMVIGVDSAGLVRYINNDGWVGATYATARTVDPINDGAPHHVVVVDDGLTDLRIYVDGEDATNLTTGYAKADAYLGFEQYIGSADPNVDQDFTGTLQDVAVWQNTVLTAGQVRRLYDMSAAAYQRTTAVAMGEVLDSAGWPASLRSLASNTTGEAAASWLEGASALSVAQQVASTEQGRFFVSGSGNITLLARYSHQLDATGNTVQATFSDDGTDAKYQDVGFNYDDVQVRNDITVTGVGVSSNATDAASVTAYGQQAATVATYLPTLGSVEQMATGLVAWRKDPQVRSLPLTAALTDTAQYASLLGLELGERVKFEITPPGTGSQSAQELILEQMDWDISNALWELTVQGSPIPPDVFILDSSLLDGADVLGF